MKSDRCATAQTPRKRMDVTSERGVAEDDQPSLVQLDLADAARSVVAVKRDAGFGDDNAHGHSANGRCKRLVVVNFVDLRISTADPARFELLD